MGCAGCGQKFRPSMGIPLPKAPKANIGIGVRMRRRAGRMGVIQAPQPVAGNIATNPQSHVANVTSEKIPEPGLPMAGGDGE